MLGAEEAASLTDVPNIRQKGTRLGNWLTREQAIHLYRDCGTRPLFFHHSERVPHSSHLQLA